MQVDYIWTSFPWRLLRSDPWSSYILLTRELEWAAALYNKRFVPCSRKWYLETTLSYTDIFYSIARPWRFLSTLFLYLSFFQFENLVFSDSNTNIHFLDPIILQNNNKRTISIFIIILKISGLPFPSPVDHILSELSTMTCPSWVALHSMAHSFIELDKAMVHVIRLVSFLWLWLSVCLPSDEEG